MASTLPTAVNTGPRGVGDVAAARRVVDMADKIVMLEDEKKSLITFLSALGPRKVYNHEFHWLTDQIIPKQGTVDSATPIAARAAVLTAPQDLSGAGGAALETILVADDIIKFPTTNDVYRVTATPTDMSSVQLENLIAVTTGAAAGELWVKIGNAKEENSILRTSFDPGTLNSVTTQTEDNFNYTQTFRNAFGLSRREQDSKLYGGPDRPHQRMKKMLEHCEEINNAFWHSIRTPAAAGGTGRTTTGGMIENGISAANTVAFGANIAEADLDNFLRGVCRFGNTRKRVMFCSSKVAGDISRLAKVSGGATTQVNYDGGKDLKYGVTVTKYLSATGIELDIVVDHALEGVRGQLQDVGAAPVSPDTWDGFAVVIDPENVKKAVFGGTDLQLEVDVQLPDQDGLVDAYKSDVGLQWGHPDHNGLMTGLIT